METRIMHTATVPLTMGTQTVDYGGPELGELRDSGGESPEEQRRRLAEDGYLLLRGLHDREQVLAARRGMLEVLRDEGRLDPDAPLMDGVLAQGAHGSFNGGRNRMTSLPAFRAVVESERVFGCFRQLLGAEVRTFNYKWLRVVGTGDFTGAHLDVVYMGRGTPDLYTMWTPYGDYEPENGTLALIPGSHTAPGFARLRETYGRMDVDRDHVQGWFDGDPLAVTSRFGGRWMTASFRAGDALVFGMQMLHMSTTNVTNRVRLTSDTRYQRAAEAADERWVGDEPKGHYAWNTPGKNVDMAEARKAWGV
jgi:ectoine hydroxylase-related dioxygenase (phytanoyl-CoA dioxygenase family)